MYTHLQSISQPVYTLCICIPTHTTHNYFTAYILDHLYSAEESPSLTGKKKRATNHGFLIFSAPLKK